MVQKTKINYYFAVDLRKCVAEAALTFILKHTLHNTSYLKTKTKVI